MALGSDCTGYLQSIFNPSCWMSDPLALQAGLPPQDDSSSCEQASGGNAGLYLQCMQQKGATQIALSSQNPKGATDYNSVMSGDFVDLVNPFTGSGGSIIPSWAWLGLIGVGAFIALKR